jgi:gamma-D-glutamyl-L-lysine dipeptidyl-peptidase
MCGEKGMRRRLFVPTLVGGIWMLGTGAWGAGTDPDLEPVLQAFKKTLPPNYGAGGVFQVQAQRQQGKILLQGRTLGLAEKRDLLKAMAALGPVEDKIATFPYGQPKPYARLVSAYADMRGEAKADSELVSQAILGDSFQVLGQSGDWIEVFRQWDGYVGWIEANKLAVIDTGTFSTWTKRPKVVLLEDMTTDNQQTLYRGSILSVVDESAQAWSVETPVLEKSEKLGSFSQMNLSHKQARAYQIRSRAQELQKRAVRIAQQIFTLSRSAPYSYVWGGTKGLDLDCSGFNQTVFRLAGVALPRDSYQQQGYGLPVAKTLDQLDELRPGDLVFFNENKKRATHTGIHIGNGILIHSSGHNKGLGMNNLEGDSEYERFLRRIYWGSARVPALAKTGWTDSAPLFT